MEETNLRLAENEVQVTGILTEKELNESMDKNNQPVIKGTVTIKTSDLNFVKINVYASKYTKDKRENPAFTGLQTVINEYKSVAEVGTEEATRLSVRKGQLQFRTFAGRDGNIVNAMQYSSNYFNREKNDEEPKAQINFEGYIAALTNEVDKEGEETGRLKIKCYVPLYSGIETMYVVVPAELADACESELEVGQTAEFFADIVSIVDIKKKTIQLTIGGTKTFTEKRIVNELVLTGAVKYEEDDQKSYDRELIKKGLTERELLIEELKKQDKEKVKNSKNDKTGASGRPLPNFL